MNAPQDNSPERLDDAIAWHVRLSAPNVGEDDLAGFAAWLGADPAHQAMFERVSGFDLALKATVDDNAPVQEPTVIAPRGTFSAFPFRRLGAWRPSWLAASVALAAACAVAAFVIVSTGPAHKPILYATAIGQKQTVNLGDGTVIKLNTATRLEVAVDGTERHVVLERGEALFNVAKDSAHPFLVLAGDRVVRVVGTVFDVRRDDGRVAVIVARGTVSVAPKGSAQSKTRLVPGDRLVYTAASGSTVVDRVDPERALAWQSGYLVYESAPLSRVIADLNRYFRNPIALADPTPASIRFSGVLRVDDEEAVVRRLEQFLPLTAERAADGRILLRKSQRHD